MFFYLSFWFCHLHVLCGGVCSHHDVDHDVTENRVVRSDVRSEENHTGRNTVSEDDHAVRSEEDHAVTVVHNVSEEDHAGKHNEDMDEHEKGQQQQQQEQQKQQQQEQEACNQESFHLNTHL